MFLWKPSEGESVQMHFEYNTDMEYYIWDCNSHFCRLREISYEPVGTQVAQEAAELLEKQFFSAVVLYSGSMWKSPGDLKQHQQKTNKLMSAEMSSKEELPAMHVTYEHITY